MLRVKNVFPGDDVSLNTTKSLGIYGNKAVVAGTLCRIAGHSFVVSMTNRYEPCVDDIVIGRVMHTSQDVHRIDLGGHVAVLPSLSFTNATKRNKPEINKNDYLLCKIARKGVEPLLTCVGEGFGKLKGVVLPLDPWKVRMLYLNSTLSSIGKKYRFRIAMGLNGMVWIEAEKDVDIRDIYHLLDNARYSL